MPNRTLTYVVSLSIAALTLFAGTGCPTQADGDMTGDSDGMTGDTDGMTGDTDGMTGDTDDMTGGTTGGTMTGDAAKGQTTYNSRCAGCHVLGTFDTGGFAPDLKTRPELIVNDLGTLTSSMAGINLTDEEIADLLAFIAQN